VLFLGFATLGMVSLWEAVFADVGIMSLAILNSLRLMRRDQL
jgi:Cd2+/Zn2+-exporting ATPase